MTQIFRLAVPATALVFAIFCSAALQADHIRDLQNAAIENKRSDLGHWGDDPNNYTQWSTHSSRLIPVYTFGTKCGPAGVDLDAYIGAHSAYRTTQGIQQIWGRVPERTVNPEAVYCDQTNVADIQKAALAAGKKYIFLVVFDGMDWQSTRNASIVKLNKVAYAEGRGTGLHFQDYTANGTSQFGYMVTSPLTSHAKENVNAQTIVIPADANPGGYSPELGGDTPWTVPKDIQYLIGKSSTLRHAYPDSANTASSMCAGIKTYNGSINIDAQGQQAVTIAHLAQDKGYAVGAVSSVPISHATPAAAYAHNVSRDDYQDLTRDLLGLSSIAHPDAPLPGLDVLIGGGFGTERKTDPGQGENFVPGNRYLTADDLRRADVQHSGRYVVGIRTPGKDGAEELMSAAKLARETKQRLLGFYGVGQYDGHLPFQTADGDFTPANGKRNAAESYSSADLQENPNLAQMTSAAIHVLEADPEGFWLMVEAGDVDWANHDNNLDNSIGAVFSGDAAVKVITDWVEANSSWEESVMIVTADHGHYLHLLRPELLLQPANATSGTTGPEKPGPGGAGE